MADNGVEGCETAPDAADAAEQGNRRATALFGLSREEDVAMALWRTLSEETHE